MHFGNLVGIVLLLCEYHPNGWSQDIVIYVRFFFTPLVRYYYVTVVQVYRACSAGVCSSCRIFKPITMCIFLMHLLSAMLILVQCCSWLNCSCLLKNTSECKKHGG